MADTPNSSRILRKRRREPIRSPPRALGDADALSWQACTACRQDDLQCDRGRPRCDKCRRNNTVCEYALTELAHTEHGINCPPRQACETCRNKHRKCDARRPRCGRCQERDLPCEYVLPEESASADSDEPLSLEQQLENSQREFVTTTNELTMSQANFVQTRQELMEASSDLAKNIELIHALVDPVRTTEQAIFLLMSMRLGASTDWVLTRYQQMLDAEDPDFIPQTFLDDTDGIWGLSTTQNDE